MRLTSVCFYMGGVLCRDSSFWLDILVVVGAVGAVCSASVGRQGKGWGGPGGTLGRVPVRGGLGLKGPGRGQAALGGPSQFT